MVVRTTTQADAFRLKAWFEGYMRDEGLELDQPEDGRYVSKEWAVGPSQICRRAGVNVSIGSRMFGDGKSARPYVPFAEYLGEMIRALRELLLERNHPKAQKVSAVRGFIEAGYLAFQDVVDFMEGEGLPGWMKEEDCLGGLDLGKLRDGDRLVIEEMYNFFRLREETGEEVGD